MKSTLEKKQAVNVTYVPGSFSLHWKSTSRSSTLAGLRFVGISIFPTVRELLKRMGKAGRRCCLAEAESNVKESPHVGALSASEPFGTLSAAMGTNDQSLEESCCSPVKG